MECLGLERVGFPGAEQLRLRWPPAWTAGVCDSAPGAERGAGVEASSTGRSGPQVAETRPGPGGSAGGSQRRWQEGEKSWSGPHGGHGTDARPASLGPPDHGVTSAWATVVPGLVPHPLPSVSTSFLEGLAASSEA